MSGRFRIPRFSARLSSSRGLLYAHGKDRVVLLALKHTRQLVFQLD
jgi:hypothetical protein